METARTRQEVRTPRNDQRELDRVNVARHPCAYILLCIVYTLVRLGHSECLSLIRPGPGITRLVLELNPDPGLYAEWLFVRKFGIFS